MYNRQVFDVLLLPQEWRAIKALQVIAIPASSRAIQATIGDSEFSSGRIHQILGRLTSFTLVTRDTVFIDGPFGPERRVLWQLSDEGRRLFG